MKVAIIDPLGGHGGFHYYIDHLARGLQNAGIDVSLFTVAETGITGREPYRVVVTFRRIYGSDPAIIRGMRYVLGLIKAIFWARMSGCRIVHLHSFHHDLREQLAVVLARAAGLKVVLTLHDIESFGRPSATFGRRFMLRLASALIVHNDFSRSQLARAAGMQGEQAPVFVIPSGNFIDHFPNVPTRQKARTALGLANDKMVFLFFGNSRLEKGLDLLLRAMADFADDSRILLLIAGKMKPDQQKFYEQIINEVGCSARTRMDVGHVSDEDIPSYYAAADLVVVPYRRIYESGVALMAMSFARAVLASDLPPLVEATAGGECGLLFTSEDRDDLVRALRWAVEHREALDLMGAKAKERILRERNWDTVGVQTARIYNQIDQRH